MLCDKGINNACQTSSYVTNKFYCSSKKLTDCSSRMVISYIAILFILKDYFHTVAYHNSNSFIKQEFMIKLLQNTGSQKGSASTYFITHFHVIC